MNSVIEKVKKQIVYYYDNSKGLDSKKNIVEFA